MLNLYLTCLILGGIFIGVSIFFGADGDADLGGDMDVGVDSDADVDSATEPDLSTDGQGAVDAIKFLSIRNFVFFVGAFGLTGCILTWSGTHPLLAFPLSFCVGLVVAYMMYKLMDFLKKGEVEDHFNLDDLTGEKAKVIVNLSKENRGKISIHTKNRTLQLLAQVSEEANQSAFQSGELVTIVKVKDDTVFVAEEHFIS
jgi:hypothetical protein